MCFDKPLLWKVQSYVHPKVHPNLLSKLLFYVISQRLDYKFREKADYSVCFDRIDQFYRFFYCLLAASFVIGGNSPAMYGWKEIVCMKQHFYFFLETLQIVCIC